MDIMGEDLLLIALDDDAGAESWRHATALPYGLGGALPMDLALRGRIASAGGRIVVRDASPTGDEELDAALGAIRAVGWPRASPPAIPGRRLPYVPGCAPWSWPAPSRTPAPCCCSA